MPYYLSSKFRRSLVLTSLYRYEVLRTVCQGKFNLHAVVIGIGEDAVLRKFVQAECKVKSALTLLRRRQIYSYVLYRRPLHQRCQFSVYRQYHKE
jgi:hypothetical protein